MRQRNTNSGWNRHPDADTDADLNTNRYSKTYSDAQSAPNSKGSANAKALKSAAM
jgi:hypothetical protein